ncbi:HVA22-like protein c [Linum grandiflorum]
MANGSGNFIQVVAKNFDVLALPLVTLLYPLYASIRAIETKSRTDDQQWLTYWVLYSMITLFELTFAKILECIPVWPYGKLILSCWLVLPHFNGAAHVYKQFIRPFYMNPHSVVANSTVWYVPRKTNIFSQPDDVLTAAERYIDQHGTEAFERMIINKREERISSSSNNNRRSDGYVVNNSYLSNNYTIFDDDYRY